MTSRHVCVEAPAPCKRRSVGPSPISWTCHSCGRTRRRRDAVWFGQVGRSRSQSMPLAVQYCFNGFRQALCVSARQGNGLHPERAREGGRLGAGARGGIDNAALKCQRAQLRGAVCSVDLGLCPASSTIEGDIGAAICQQGEGGAEPARARLLCKLGGGLETGGKRRAATAGQGSEAALGLNQRAGGRQEGFSPGAAKRHQSHMIAAGIGLTKKQFNRALGLGQTRHGGRSGGIDDKDHYAIRAIFITAQAYV